jgi:hypothetical protein
MKELFVSGAEKGKAEQRRKLMQTRFLRMKGLNIIQL